MNARPCLLLIFSLCACATSAPYQPKRRAYEPGPYAQEPSAKDRGSLLGSGPSLLEDTRASRVGDVLVIRIDESDSASHDTSTELDRSSKQAYGVSGAFQQAAPDVDFESLFGATADARFAGGGRIQRRGSVRAVLPVRVQQVLPNGDLFVEGTKVVLVGEEERHLYVSGVVRASDVLADGSVLSSRLADAEIEYTGAGDATDQQRPGWLARALSVIWPF